MGRLLEAWTAAKGVFSRLEEQPSRCLSFACSGRGRQSPAVAMPWPLAAMQPNLEGGSWVLALWAAAAHLGRKLEYLLNNVYFICGHCSPGPNPC